MNSQMMLGSAAALREPVLSANGEWGTAAGMAVLESLSQGSLDGVMDVLDHLDGPMLASVLQETGFEVASGVVEQGRDAVLAGVQKDLIEAVNQRVDGFDVRAGRVGVERPRGFAAKDADAAFRGNRDAAADIQGVLAARGVEVDLLGDAPTAERAALLCIAGQALQAGVQGFGFDGIAGKFKVPYSLSEVVDLHRAAAAAVATESVREAIDTWRSGGKVGELSKWVPDSVQRVLQGSLSENAAHVLVRAVDQGAVAEFASEAGAHAITQTLAQAGLDVNAPTIAQQAEALNLMMVDPDRQRGKYLGPVVAVDHRAGLIKYARGCAVEIPFTGLADGRTQLRLGEYARLEFNKGAMTVKVAERESPGVGR